MCHVKKMFAKHKPRHRKMPGFTVCPKMRILQRSCMPSPGGELWAFPRQRVYKLFVILPCVDLGEAAFAGFPEAVVQVDAGFLHSPADHIIADVPGAGEEVA